MLAARHGAFKRAVAGDTIVCNIVMFGNRAVWPRPWAELPGGLAWSCTVTPGGPRPLWTGFGQAARPRGRRERLRKRKEEEEEEEEVGMDNVGTKAPHANNSSAVML